MNVIISLMKISSILFIYLYSNYVNAFGLLNENITLYEVLPLFNVHEKANYVPSSLKGINKNQIIVPDSVKLHQINSKIKANGFIGDVVFKDIIMQSSQNNIKVNIKTKNIESSGIKIVSKIVTNWYQAGFTTRQKKYSGELTYELLLSNDQTFQVNDKWLKSPKGGWIYIPPVISNSNNIETILSPKVEKRLLFKILISDNTLPGKYISNIEIITKSKNVTSRLIIPIDIHVKSIKLTNNLDKKYKLILYTGFKLNDQIESDGSYVNTMRLSGDNKNRNRLFNSYLSDIRAHGFNGVTIRDWDTVNLNQTLKISKQLGLKNIILHSTTPINKKLKLKGESIISDSVKSIYANAGVKLYYYGYDEQGGNKFLDKQLKLNKKIHGMSGDSVNAIFWDDMPIVLESINEDESKCFDIIAHSMGSHGNKQMFQSLPYKQRDDKCSKLGTEYLTYWHPNVENPVINRLFMGFWLWASGFDGVIPHGYYFPPHIEKILTKHEIKNGVSTATSPYNDWAFWLLGSPLRHHNSVYPSSNGPVGTLEWEGILNGYIDLKYIVTLEDKLENANIDGDYRVSVNILLNDIRSTVLKIDSPYMSDKDSIHFLIKMESWKNKIAKLLLN